MNFFQQLESLGQGMDLVLRIKGKDGTITMSVEPQAKNASKVKPLVLTGTAAELDEGFFDQVTGQMNAIKGLLSNLDQVKRDAETKEKEASKEKKAPAYARSSKAAKAAKEKKIAQKDKTPKREKRVKEEKSKTAPALLVGDMFSQPAPDLLPEA
ncbi:MAG TPA: PRTRC system protein E [Puia sp.]|jgi:PRTRC genetic system protein E|nr:PRTRC system protein E [Puia sp.]